MSPQRRGPAVSLRPAVRSGAYGLVGGSLLGLAPLLLSGVLSTFSADTVVGTIPAGLRTPSADLTRDVERFGAWLLGSSGLLVALCVLLLVALVRRPHRWTSTGVGVALLGAAAGFVAVPRLVYWVVGTAGGFPAM